MNKYWSGGLFCKKDIEKMFRRKAYLHERVTLAVLRLSRHRYIDANFVRDAIYRLSACAMPHQPWSVSNRAEKDSCMYRSTVTGLMDGEVPFQAGGPEFIELRDFLQKKKTPKSPPVELFILNLTIKELKNAS